MCLQEYLKEYSNVFTRVSKRVLQCIYLAGSEMLTMGAFSVATISGDA